MSMNSAYRLPKVFFSLLFLVAGVSTVTSPGFAAAKDFRKRGGLLKPFTEDDILAEQKFGKLLAAKVLGRYRLYREDASITKYVNLTGLGLARYSGRPELTFHFAILDSDSVNAFAVPGGYIFITRGALAIMNDEAELAGVLAHEIAHVSQKHMVRELNIRAVDSSGVSTFAALVQAVAGGGSVSAIFQELSDRAAELLFEKGLKKRDELEADRIGVMIAAEAGYRSSALREYLGRIHSDKERGKGMLTYIKTHPSSRDRVQNIIAFERESGLKDMSGKSVKERFVRYISK